MNAFAKIISAHEKPALLVGNGINRFDGNGVSDWKQLLHELARKNGVKLTDEELGEMSNTELFDILDLAKPKENGGDLRRQFCDPMAAWRPGDHHTTITGWARRHNRPIITVNFDENLSRSVDVGFHRDKEAFTDFYPWSSYFSDHRIANPRSSFAIWHAHGMVRYPRSIRLGLTHYMGSVQRARSWLYGDQGLRVLAKSGSGSWRGSNTWLEVALFCPLLIFGFTFGKDESFLRWLFLERARLHKIKPTWKIKTWFVEKPKNGSLHRKRFFEALGMEYVRISDYSEIYQSSMWRR